MQKKNPKTRCERRTLSKCEDVCRFYSKIQSSYADELEANPDITKYQCNVLLDGLEMGEYTTDFLCWKNDGTLRVRECVPRKHLTFPSVAVLLDASHDYWTRRGVEDWGIIIDREKDTDD